jgi:hypothetical protein
MRSREQGVALIAVLLTMTLLAALGGGLLQVMTTEAWIAVHHRHGLEALYAAEALVERVVAELSAAPDVDAVLAGAVRSAVVDDPAGGVRVVDGAPLDLSVLTNLERCGRSAACSHASMDVVTAERPWGVNNPRWRLYAHAWMQQLVDTADAPPVYLIAWLGDDPFENDGDPLRDGAGRGHHRLAVRVRAYGRQGARREIEVVVADVPDRPRVVRWVERP